MLVLTRKPHESIRISDDTEVVVLAIGGSKVRLAIRCPDGVPIDRGERHGRSSIRSRRELRCGM